MLEVARRQGDEANRKENVLLLNKADLVSTEQRKLWAEYFMQEKIDFIFFSAIEEQERIEDYREQQQQLIEEEDEEEKKEIEEIKMPVNPWDIYNVDQLKLYFKVGFEIKLNILLIF